MHRPHGVHRIFPAPLLAEAAPPGVFMGAQGRVNTGLAHCLGELEYFFHGSVLLGVMDHACYVLSRAARRACMAFSRCQRSVTSRSTAAMPRTSPGGSCTITTVNSR